MEQQINLITEIFESNSIRICIDDINNPLFCASDICNILGYGNVSAAIDRHCKMGGITKKSTPTTSGIQNMYL